MGWEEMLEQRGAAWLQAIGTRRSRRRFRETPVAEPLLSRIEEVCAGFRPFGRVRAVLVRQAPAGLFRGVIGAYGSVQGSPHCLVVAGPGDAAAETGYVGEAAVLEATAQGLGTCWVGGLFDREVAAKLLPLEAGERVFAVSPVGHQVERHGLGERLMTAAARSRTRKSLEVIAPGAASWPPWARAGAEAARLSPSALNRQPWRFILADDSVTLAVDSLRDNVHLPKRLDCGIAMLHFELAALAAGIGGTWRLEAPPRVAVFSARER